MDYKYDGYKNRRLTDELIQMEEAKVIEQKKFDRVTLLNSLINERRSVVIICQTVSQADYYMQNVRNIIETSSLKDVITKRGPRIVQFGDSNECRRIQIFINPDSKRLVGHFSGTLVVMDER